MDHVRISNLPNFQSSHILASGGLHRFYFRSPDVPFYSGSKKGNQGL